MRRNKDNIVRDLEEFWDELAHNYSVYVCLGQERDYLEYLLKRIYNIIYDTNEPDEE